MPLSPGTRLGHYDVTALLGEGGMGQVWQATDTQLNRQVALKILPDAFAADPDRLARFTREAQILASLNHPNIAAIFGIEEAKGTRALVLELVEGPTLADRIAKGPIPLDEALPIAKQIAEALEAAHEAGVIHRDLKPANIKVREDGTVKVLDFGLAKALDPNPNADPSQSPTLTAAATQMGVIMGTAAYMSPEQAKGKTVDKRADIWAYGAVLFEMLTGKKLFDAGDVSEMLASVLIKDPDISSIGSHVPAHIRSVLRRCLVKDPKDRLRDIGDVRLAMTGAFETTVSAAAGPTAGPRLQVWQRPWPVLATVVTAVILSALTVWSLTRPGVPPVTRFSIPVDRSLGASLNSPVALSPDGRTLVYQAQQDGVVRLYQRQMSQIEARPVRDTENAVAPFFSPDGTSVGFYDISTATLERVSLAGGIATTLTSMTGFRGASWGPNGTIVFSSIGSGLRLVAEGGGTPEQIAEAQPGQNYLDPAFVPNGDAVLFTVSFGLAQPSQIAVLSLDSREQRALLEGSSPRLLPTGHLLFNRADGLWAVPFDVRRLEVTGEPVPVLEGIVNAEDIAQYAVSSDGTLVYVEGGGLAEAPRTLALVDRTGAVERLDVPTNQYVAPRLSPDGRRLAVQTDGDSSAIWTYDLAGDSAIRQLTLEGNNVRPLWTPDGDSLTFASDRDGSFSIYRQRADGSGVTERLTTADEGTAHWPDAWSPDGNTLAFRVEELTGGGFNAVDNARDLWTLSLENPGEPRVLSAVPYPTLELGASFSPDGQWIVYTSGTAPFEFEVYVEPFPTTGEKHKISQEQGVMPLWSQAGDELFYRPVTQGPEALQTLKSVTVSTDPPFRFSSEQSLPIGAFISVQFYRSFDVTPDGQRFLVVLLENETADADPGFQIEVVENWLTELKRLVPID